MFTEKKVRNRKFLLFTIWIFTLVVLVSDTIANLMFIDILPKDWYFFHSFLERTGIFRKTVSLGPFLNFIISFVLNRHLLTYLILLILHFVNKKFKILTEKSTLLIIFWFLSSITLDALGNVFGWYAVNESYGIIWYDDFSHVFGGFVATTISFILWENIISNHGIYLPLRYKIILSVLTGLAIYTFYEIYEFYSDIIFKTTMVGGVADSMTDIVYNTVGATIATIFLAICYFKGGLTRSFIYRYLTNIKD